MSAEKHIADLKRAMQLVCDIDRAMGDPRGRAAITAQAPVDPVTRKHVEEWAAAKALA